MDGLLRWLGGLLICPRMRASRQRFLQQARECLPVQRATLARILAENAESAFLQERGLTAQTSLAEFRRRAPIGDYETFRPWIDRLRHGDYGALLGCGQKPLMFSLSSGTTAEPKYIPITKRFLEDYRRGWQVWGIGAFDAHPRLHNLDIVQLGSDHDQFRTPAGLPCGNISGLVSAMQSPVVRAMYAIPPEVSRIRDPELKTYLAARFALARARIGLVMTANASTLIQLASVIDQDSERLIREIRDGGLRRDLPLAHAAYERLSAVLRRPDPARARALEACRRQHGRLLPQHYWPDLSLVAVWTGGSAGYYLPRLRDYFGQVPVRDHGLSASEGRMTIPVSDYSPAGLLDIGSHYFEFVPEAEHGQEQPTVLEAHELTPGQSYYILLTTPSGLTRYDICDVVRCTGFYGTTPYLEFLHKGAHVSNLTGEKLAESQVLAAVKAGAERFRVDLGQFTLSPIWSTTPHYRLHVEPLADLRLTREQLGRAIDQELQSQNCEYRDKRRSGRLGPLDCVEVDRASWQLFARGRQTRPGGSLEQYKHPCLSPDVEFSQRLLALRPERAAA